MGVLNKIADETGLGNLPEMHKLEDGIILSLPVADDREIMMKILQYGSKAKVLEPLSLQKQITTEIAQMAHLY